MIYFKILTLIQKKKEQKLLLSSPKHKANIEPVFSGSHNPTEFPTDA